MDNSNHQNSVNLGRYWALVCHRRWWLIAAFFVGWSGVVGTSWYLPAKYRSETVILVEQQQVPERYVESNVAIDLQQRLQSITQQILSRTRLAAIVQNYHLYAAEGQWQPAHLVQGILLRSHATARAGDYGCADRAFHRRQPAQPATAF